MSITDRKSPNKNVQKKPDNSRTANEQLAENSKHFSDEKIGRTDMVRSLGTIDTTPKTKHPRRSHSQGSTGTPSPAKSHP